MNGLLFQRIEHTKIQNNHLKTFIKRGENCTFALILFMIFKKYISILFLASLFCALQAQDKVVPKYEYRAVWLTTIENLDWPRVLVKNPSDIARQKQELCVILDSLEELNVNTVLLQTRVRGDVIYPSAIEPFSHVLTGVEGKDPGYDPLGFAIEECHKRGMQLHAWLVTMPLGKDVHIARQGKMALSRKRRALCTHYRGAWYMEPGNPETADYLVALVNEIVRKYNVDGIHLDYIRYPDRTTGYPDASLYRKYGKGLSLGAWRRKNITGIARRIYECVKSVKPWVRVSCAPLGKYDNLSRYSSLGWDARNAVFQEAQEWMRDGIMDIIFPMLYFNGNNFYPFVRDWQENSYGRHVVPGVGIYRLVPKYGGWPAMEVKRQMHTSREAGTAGTAMFRTAHLLGNAGGGRELFEVVYGAPALVPPMLWHGTRPSAPVISESRRENHAVTFSWGKVAAKGGEPAIKYNVYAAVGDTVDTGDIGNLVAHSLSDTLFVWNCRTAEPLSVAVTAVDAYGVESEPAVALFAGNKALLETVHLPEPRSWGQRIELLDVHGRRLYFGRYSRSVGLHGLQGGCYILNVYDRHGARLFSRKVVR